jgi:hypothetical protein
MLYHLYTFQTIELQAVLQVACFVHEPDFLASGPYIQCKLPSYCSPTTAGA